MGDGVKCLFDVKKKTAATWRLFVNWLCQVLVTCRRASWVEEQWPKAELAVRKETVGVNDSFKNLGYKRGEVRLDGSYWQLRGHLALE